jgi:hypothetical protein
MAVISSLVKRGFSVFLALALVLSVGCGGAGQAGSSGESLEQTDATVEISFAIEVADDVSDPIYVLLYGEDNQVGWIQAFRDGERIHFRERCEIEDCANRGVVCGSAMSTIRNIGAGAETGTIEFVWDGMTSGFDEVSGCEIRRPALPGDYIARFCYSREAELQANSDPALAVPGRLVSPDCTERPFTLLDEEVVFSI